MLWGPLSYKRTLDIVWIDGRMDSQYDTQILQTVLAPVVDTLLPHEWVLQQDNAAVYTFYTSRHTLEFLDEHDIDFVNWPAKFPDLNIIKNVWGRLATNI